MTSARLGMCLAAAALACGGPLAQAADRLPQQAELKAIRGAEFDFLGTAVAVSGHTIVATAPTHMSHGRVVEGKALVFFAPWHGVRHPSATLKPPSSATYDGFGVSVAITGDTIVVGSGGSGFGNDRFRGRAYVFVKPRGGWHGTLSPAATLTPSDGGAGDQFGYSVSISGRTIAVGAPGHRHYHGEAYVFVKPGGGWHGTRRESARLSAGRGEPGFSVAVSGSTVVVGAPFRGRGAAWVFARPRAGWHGTRRPDASLSVPASARGLGRALAIEGATIVASAPDGGVHGERSDVYVYTRPGSGWAGPQAPAATLTAPDKVTSTSCGTRGDRRPSTGLGRSLAISGDRIVVNAGQAGVNFRWLGAVCVFTRPATGWSGTITDATIVRRPTGSGSQSSHFSWHVAADGDTLVVSADGLRSGTTLSVGAVFVF